MKCFIAHRCVEQIESDTKVATAWRVELFNSAGLIFRDDFFCAPPARHIAGKIFIYNFLYLFTLASGLHETNERFVQFLCA